MNKLVYIVLDAHIYEAQNNQILIYRNGKETFHNITNNTLDTLKNIFKKNKEYAEELDRIEFRFEIFAKKESLDKMKKDLLTKFNGNETSYQYISKKTEIDEKEYILQEMFIKSLTNYAK
jgi:hypothetical protein